MLFVSAVNVALGWGWHIAYRARHHWSLKREGALVAAATVALIGAVDTVHSARSPKEPGSIVAPSAALTASATPVVTESQPIEIKPAAADPAIETVAAAQAPAVPPMPADDPIADKINERLGEPTATGSIAAGATPSDDPDALDPVDAATLVKPKPAKPAKIVKPAKAEQSVKPAKPAKVADHRKPKTEPKSAN
ncbi:MAG: hypothetical protein ACREDP_19940 [Bradyrhizobium sp.]